MLYSSKAGDGCTMLYQEVPLENGFVLQSSCHRGQLEHHNSSSLLAAVS